MDKVSMFVDYLTLYILPNKKRNGNERWQSTRKKPAFLPVTDGFQQKWDAILFNTERNLVELLLVENDILIKKLELDFNKELKKHFPDSIEENRSVIKKKHQPYKKQLSIKRREKKAG